MYEKYKLDYGSLYPYIGDENLGVHYNKLYDGYLFRLNKLLVKNGYNYGYSMPDLVKNIDVVPISDRGEILYNLGGVLNHSLYFYNMSDKGNNKLVGSFRKKILETYGSYENFRNKFVESAKNLKGSGYTFLIVDSRGDFKIINTSNQDTPYSYGYTPVMALDLWEHAYYLDYKSNRDLYINNFFKLVDFEKINKLYEQVTKKEA